MATEKSKKGAIIFICEKCNFKCNKKSNYNKHILTAKHINQHNQQEKCQKGAKNAKNYNKLLCECGKTYKDRSGLWRHKKKSFFWVLEKGPWATWLETRWWTTSFSYIEASM